MIEFYIFIGTSLLDVTRHSFSKHVAIGYPGILSLVVLPQPGKYIIRLNRRPLLNSEHMIRMKSFWIEFGLSVKFPVVSDWHYL